jgi:hypothetical protein
MKFRSPYQGVDLALVQCLFVEFCADVSQVSAQEGVFGLGRQLPVRLQSALPPKRLDCVPL